MQLAGSLAVLGRRDGPLILVLEVSSFDDTSSTAASVRAFCEWAIALRSGEYSGRNTRRAPTARIALRTAFPLWEPRLSRITISPGLRVGDEEPFDVGEEALAIGVDAALVGSPARPMTAYVRPVLLARNRSKHW